MTDRPLVSLITTDNPNTARNIAMWTINRTRNFFSFFSNLLLTSIFGFSFVIGPHLFSQCQQFLTQCKVCITLIATSSEPYKKMSFLYKLLKSGSKRRVYPHKATQCMTAPYRWLRALDSDRFHCECPQKVLELKGYAPQKPPHGIHKIFAEIPVLLGGSVSWPRPAGQSL